MFEHINLSSELERIREFATGESCAVAYHGDADGFFAAHFLGRITSVLQDHSFNVQTGDLDFNRLIAASKQHNITDLILLDINVLSAQGGLNALADAIGGRLLVYDDHFGEKVPLPSNVELVPLLPPNPQDDSIRPTSLFSHRILAASHAVNWIDDAFVVAAAFGEGVYRQFSAHLPQLSKQETDLARRIGRGINAYFTDTSIDVDDGTLLRAARDLRAAEPADPSERYASMLNSSLVKIISTAAKEVDRQVEQIVREAVTAGPWYADAKMPIYFVKVESSRRIVNLVASSLRTTVDKGIVIAVQPAAAGLAVEIRRARSMTTPNLVEALMSLNPDAVISRGGHPMAAGATLKHDGAEDAIQVLQQFVRRSIADRQ
ncbi:DHH family phosphoesterase [Mycobacterium sp. pW049]|uniref:DHH family phosphoesterase n=1 Tax=[Mycobacterium] bulgaricum TaxID=3238985 RepID=UPI00351BC9EB